MAMKEWLQWLLSRPVWQGLAGIAQGIAAILAVVAVWQAKRMLRQNEHARHALVAPEWVITNDANRVEGVQVAIVDIRLQNVGFGPACDFSVQFESGNGHHQHCVIQRSSERGANVRSIIQGDTLHIGLNMSNDQGPLTGSLVVCCKNVLGREITRRYVVEGDAQTRRFRID